MVEQPLVIGRVELSTRDAGRPPRSRARLPRSGKARVWTLTAGLSALALVIHLQLVAPLPALGAPEAVPWLVLFGVFVLVEVHSVHVTFGRQAHSWSMNEVPLVLGLVFASPTALVTAHLAGSAVALIAHRRQSPFKWAFNLSIVWLETLVAVLLYRAFLGNADPIDVTGWLATVAAVALATVPVSMVAVPTAASLMEGRFNREMFRWTAVASLVAIGVNTALGLVAVTVVWYQPRAAVLVGIISAIVLAAYRAHSAAREKEASLHRLHELTSRSADVLGLAETADVLLGQAMELLHGGRAALLLLGPDGTPDFERTACSAPDAGPGGDGNAHRALRAALAAGWPDLTARSRLVPRRTRGVRERAFLEAAGVKDAVIAPLRSDDHAIGILLVGDRLEDFSTFTADDQRLLETLANHASIMLHNSRLVGRLRDEVAERRHEALHDSLTGLPNRVSFNEEIAGAITDRPLGASHAVVLLDLDHFKDVNDTLGHHTGDALLRSIGDVLAARIGEGNVVARLGGDEFALLLRDIASPAAALERAEAVRSILSVPFDVGALRLQVGASAGIALCPEHGEDASTLLRRADVAMYQAKGDRSGIEVYDWSRDEHSPRRLALTGRLGEAIEEGDLEVHYQPKALLRTGAVKGVEALARWRHARYGPITPDEFVPMAEQTGLIRSLTNMVLDEVLAQWRRWREEGLDLEIAVNLSMWSLLDQRLPEDVHARLAANEVPPDRLRLEITESTMMRDPHRVEQVLRALADTGIGLSVDDYGTGYSSLAWLKRLPVDEVKIDRTFVQHLSTDDDDAAIVRSTIELARSLNLWVVAEGAEDQWTWNRLAALGCDIAQGYHLSPPLPAADLASFLARHAATLGSEAVGSLLDLRAVSEAGAADRARSGRAVPQRSDLAPAPPE